ncbi:MAG: twin-arginine translocase TatA/TatE family subunit [Candidatus Poribacteria bacterium]
MPSWLGGGEIALIVILALLLFGSRRLPEMARSVGQAIQEFKKVGKQVQTDVETALKDEPTKDSTSSTSSTSS